MLRSFIAITAVILLACSTQPAREITSISPENKLLKITGRVKHHKDSVQIYWPATTVEITFRGTNLTADLSDENGQNYFNVEVDHDSVFFVKLKKGRHLYTILEHLTDTIHTVKLIKRTEWDKGKSVFYKFLIEDGELLEPAKPSGRIIEFFGNSITAGYAIEDNTGGDSPDSVYTNSYNTYAAITARHFNADLYLTVKSGIGIMVSWFPLIMPEMYNRLDPQDSTSLWDFAKMQPDIVAINLFQNDSWLVEKPEHPSFKMRFGKTKPSADYIINAYADFLVKIRAAYPNTKIICLLGSMDILRQNSPWPGYVEAAVKKINDKEVFVYRFPFLARNGHPRVSDNKIMADSLISFIEENLSW